MMNVVTNNGDKSCETVQEIIDILINNSYDDIWISGEEEYPCLAVLTNGSLACVHYFLNDTGNMWQSAGDYDKDVMFITGGEESEMPADSIITLEKAIECVKEFRDTLEKPDCIEWREL